MESIILQNQNIDLLLVLIAGYSTPIWGRTPFFGCLAPYFLFVTCWGDWVSLYRNSLYF